MSGGHWEYLCYKIEERIGVPLDDVWRLLASIEHALDYGICCDTCYECAKIRTINALEAYFDTGATSVENSSRLLKSSESECSKCKKWEEYRKGIVPKAERESVTAEMLYEGKMYKGVLYLREEGSTA